MLSTFTTTFATVLTPVTARTRDAAGRARAGAARLRHAPARDRRPARTVQLLCGLLLVGTGVALVITADLGVASWDVLHVGLAERTGASVGTVAAVVAVAATGLAALLGERPRLGTLVPVAVIAPTIDLVLAAVTVPTDPAGQVALLAAGMVLMATGVGAYVTSDHGAGPGDLVFLAVANRGVPVGAARFLVDGTLVTVGWWVGGPVGIGTVLLTAGLGPLVATAIRLFDLAPARAEIDRRDRAYARRLSCRLHRELAGPNARPPAPAEAPLVAAARPYVVARDLRPAAVAA